MKKFMLKTNSHTNLAMKLLLLSLSPPAIPCRRTQLRKDA